LQHNIINNKKNNKIDKHSIISYIKSGSITFIIVTKRENLGKLLKVIGLISILVVLMLTFGCTFINDTINSSPISIYFLQNDSLDIFDILEEDINMLSLKNKPFLSSRDIDFYDWSSHCLYLKSNKANLFPDWEIDAYNQFPEEWTNKPFVIVSKKTRCCIGYFSNKTSRRCRAPVISDVINNIIYPQDVLFIDWPWAFRENPLDSELMKENLQETEFFRGGIDIIFDTISTILSIENSDTSTINYTFTISNNDFEELYILDPDKTGGETFHYYNGGPIFLNLETQQLYEPISIKEPKDSWTYDWYTKLESGQSIQRTVSIKGYPYFSSGKYMFEFSYYSVTIDMEKEVREVDDGRIWLGPTRSNILIMELNIIDSCALVKLINMR
jgi:hypothetical protein